MKLKALKKRRKIDQPDSSRKKERRIKSTKLEKGQITKDNAEIKRIMRLL